MRERNEQEQGAIKASTSSKVGHNTQNPTFGHDCIMLCGKNSMQRVHMGGAANGKLEKGEKRKVGGGAGFGSSAGTYGKQRVHTRVGVNSKETHLSRICRMRCRAGDLFC